MQKWGGAGQEGGNGAPMVVETCGHKFKVRLRSMPHIFLLCECFFAVHALALFDLHLFSSSHPRQSLLGLKVKGGRDDSN